MADFNQINQFGSVKPVRSGEGTSCAECEAMLPEMMDGTLSAKDRAAFDLHIATCAECSQMLADTQRGASLLAMLKSPRPEPSAALLERILSQTSGAQISGTRISESRTNGFAVPAKSAASGVIALPALDGAAAEIHSAVSASTGPSNILPFRPRPIDRFNLKSLTHTMMQPRLAMTAAMAFFSITLTLNLTGIHLTDLKASDLTPSNLKHSFYHANASVVRYYDNLRVVYELESRVNELKRTSESDNPPATANPDTREGTDKDQAKPRKTPKSGSGTSERRGAEDRHGMEDRRSPLDQEFKLAGYGRNPFTDQAVIENKVLAARTNKSKETLQEGDLV